MTKKKAIKKPRSWRGLYSFARISHRLIDNKREYYPAINAPYMADIKSLRSLAKWINEAADWFEYIQKKGGR